MSTDRGSDRLGLALAGGGFRAALYHLGVLYRLAELDLLRRVEVLSTVSGGSVTGALYVLRLKKWLEEHGRLTAAQYRTLVTEVDAILSRGVARNLRTRLLLNPLTTLKVMLSQHSLGRAMARLYERHLLAPAIADLAPAPVPGDARGSRPGALPLGALRIRPKGADLSHGVDAYNAEQLTTGGSVITRVVFNATTLNSGGRFLFSAVEVGDWYLGHFRRDELEPLLERRALLTRWTVDELEEGLPRAAGALTTARDPVATAALALWWLRRKAGKPAPLPEAWRPVQAVLGRFPGDLPGVSLGALRQAKVHAWYLLEGPLQSPPVTGGRSPDEHWERIGAVLGDLDPDLARAARALLAPGDLNRDLFLDFLLELYLLRTAERMSGRFGADWDRLTVGDAVGASACFPPVFPPFVLLGLYDDRHVSRLGLTDGGVYDNTGVMALLDEGCTSIIASDTGAVFTELPAAPRGHVSMSLRIPGVLMRVTGGLQRLALRERRRVSRDARELADALPSGTAAGIRAAVGRLHDDRVLSRLAYFHMAGAAPRPEHDPPPLDLAVDGRRLAGLRTDLDGFGEVEIAALVNHGYDSADRFVRRYFPRFAEPGAAPPPGPPRPSVGGRRVEKVLEAGASRFLRAVKVRAPVSVAVVLALLGLLAWFAATGVTVARLWGWAGVALAAGGRALTAAMAPLPDGVEALLARVVTFLPAVAIPWLAAALGSAWLLPTLLVAAVAVGVLRRVKAEPGGAPGRARAWLRTAWKWGSSYAANILWLAWALPLLLALGLSLVLALGWLLFFLPWRAAARIRPGDEVAATAHRSALRAGAPGPGRGP